MATESDVNELRVLIFAPVGRDAELTSEVLNRASLPCHVCLALDELCRELERGAGAVLLTEEALHSPQLTDLAETLERQPAWSDIAVLLFTGSERSHAGLRSLRLLEGLRNVTLLDRPIRVAAVVSTVQAALRGRARQLELRDVLVALHRARDDAERANRLKDEFLATLSHELRTPLNAILGWAAMGQRGQVTAERIPRVFDIIERNARMQSQLVEEILDMSRLVTGRTVLHPVAVHMPQLIADVVESARPSADAKDIRLRFDAQQDLPAIRADVNRLKQVLWNLLSNAVKFTPPQGEITVRTHRRGSQIEISVTDTGAGLTPEFLPFAFDRFRQADQSFTRAQGGLGLGLAIVKHLVEMHGGTVAAESPGLGRGATFRVCLPIPALAAEALPAVEPQAAELLCGGTEAPRATSALGGRLLLVVDDHAGTRELLTQLLTQYQARVRAVGSARAALAAFDDEVPALVLADIGLPEEDGLSLMRQIRARPAESGGRVPSLALSAYVRSTDRSKARAAGFDDFLAKPAQPDDVINAIERLLDHGSIAAHES